MKVSILDYSFAADNMLVMFSTPENKPNPNTFQFNPRHCDVIEMAMDLSIISGVDDYDNGLNGQALRVGSDVYQTGKISYFPYNTVMGWISGEAQELIALRLAEKEWQRICKEENAILESII
jgi:hypothetical protein